MTTIDALMNRIQRQIAAEAERQKAARAEQARANREREQRLSRYETDARHIQELWKPRLAALVERFQALVMAESTVGQHTRVVTLTFAATVARATVRFEVFPDHEARHVRLGCTQEILPARVRQEPQPPLEIPLGGVQDEAVVAWFDDRVVAFVEAHIALVRQDAVLRERLEDQFVEDPVARVRFPRDLASSTLECDGMTYYFVDEETRREFEHQPAAQGRPCPKG